MPYMSNNIYLSKRRCRDNVHHTFKNLQGCGTKTERELVELCQETEQKFFEICFMFLHNKDKKISSGQHEGQEGQEIRNTNVFERLSAFQEHLFIQYYQNQIQALSARARNWILSITEESNDGRDSIQRFHAAVVLPNFRINEADNVGRKTEQEIVSFHRELINLSNSFTSEATDEVFGYLSRFIENHLGVTEYDFRDYKPAFLNRTFPLFSFIDSLIKRGNIFSETELPIFYHRFNYFSNQETLTLEQIGTTLNLTRERVRQISKRINAILHAKLSFLVILLQYTDYNIDLQEDQEILIVPHDFVHQVNLLENVHFSQKFYTKVFSFLMIEHRLFLEDRKDETNVYLIRNDLYNEFAFDAFYEDIEEKGNERIIEPYVLNFEGYLYSFLKKDDIGILERIAPICEKILLEDFNLFVDLEGNLRFERTTKKAREEYVFEILEEVGQPMHVDDIYARVEEKFPGKLSNVSAVRGAFSKRPDLFIYFGRASTYGLKKWEDEDNSIKGGTIKDIVEEYLLEFGPIHISKIFTYVSQYRNTSQTNIYNSLRIGDEKRFVFFEGAHIGLKSKDYKKLKNFSPLESKNSIRKKGKRVSKDALISAYYEVYNKLGSAPNSVDIDKYGIYASRLYSKKFGGWHKFIESIGESTTSPNSTVTEDDLIADYYEVKNILGHPPISADMKQLGKYSFSAYRRLFGGWSKFLKSLGESPAHAKLRVTNEELIAGYYELKEQLGHSPNTKEMDQFGKYSITTYYTRFEGWKTFLEKIGEPVLENSRSIPKDDLISAYYELKEKVGHPPTTSDLQRLGQYSYEAYRHHFGGWRKFLEFLGETSNS